jgi:hypothetical protein
MTDYVDESFGDSQKSEMCEYCLVPLESTESVSFHHYFDKEYKIWVTHWDTEDYVYCGKCKRVEKYVRDEFETPLFPEKVPLKIWRERQEKMRQRKAP